MSVLDFDLTGGMMTVEDVFTPYNEALLDGQDGDLGSGGPVLLPTQTLASGKILNPLVEIGKSGMIYILDRDNNTDGSNNPATEYSPAGLGGFNASSDQAVQEVQTPITTASKLGFRCLGHRGLLEQQYLFWRRTWLNFGFQRARQQSHCLFLCQWRALCQPTSQSPDQYIYPGPDSIGLRQWGNQRHRVGAE